MTDRRSSPRVETTIPARIRGASGDPVACTVRDRSEFGALISVAGTQGIPDVFDLEIPDTGETLRASVAWREAGALGVMVE